MIIMMPEHRVKRTAKRLRQILRELGIDFKHLVCLELAVRMCGFDDWRHYLARDLDEPLSPFDEYLSDSEFAARDEFQVSVLETAGLGPVARKLLNRVNPTGSWSGTVEPLLTELLGDTAQMKASLAGAGDSVRVRLVAAVAAGAGTKATAEAMGVPYREAQRWIEAWREHGAVAPRKFGSRSKLDEHEDFLRQLVDERPSIKLDGIRDALAQRDVRASNTAIWNALERFGIALAGRRARQSADTTKLTPNTTSHERTANEDQRTVHAEDTRADASE
jgi:transposase